MIVDLTHATEEFVTAIREQRKTNQITSFYADVRYNFENRFAVLIEEVAKVYVNKVKIEAGHIEIEMNSDMVVDDLIKLTALELVYKGKTFKLKYLSANAEEYRDYGGKHIEVKNIFTYYTA